MTQQPTPPDPHPDDQSDDRVEAANGIPHHPMGRTPLYEAYNSARYQRQEIIRKIQALTNRRLICYVSADGCGIDRDDTLHFNDLVHHLPSGQDVELMLHTLGGDPDIAEKLIRLLRSKVGTAELHIIVPEHAKSAGTLMVLGADRVVMSDTSELGPIDPQMLIVDSNGIRRWQPVQTYLDAYEENARTAAQNPNDLAAQIMLNKLDPPTIKNCEAVKERARQSAESLLRSGMFRNGGNWSLTVSELLDTRRWLTHSQMISWEEAQHPNLGLHVDYLELQSPLWQQYWQLYCLQRLAIRDDQKLYESDFVSMTIGGSSR